MNLTWDDIYKGALLANLVVTVMLAFLQLWLRDKFVPRKEFEATKELINAALSSQANQIGLLNTKVALMEQEVRHLPTAEDLERLTTALAALQRDQAASSATLAAVDAATKRIENYLLRNKT